MRQDCVHQLLGFVKDEHGEAIPGATVWIASLQLGATTDKLGQFQFDNLCAGNYTLEVRFLGYENTTESINLPHQQIPCIVLHDTKMLHEVVVEGEHLQHHTLSQAVSTLQYHELEKLRGKPLGDMVQQLPGVSAVITGPNIFKPMIQGLYGQRILVLNNGVRLEGQQWGIDHAPEVDPFTAATIEVVKGAEAVRFGADAMGGVIILSPASLRKMRQLAGEFHVVGATNGRAGTFSAMLEGHMPRSHRWNWRMQGTLKRAGDFQAAHYNLANTGATEANASAALGYYDDKKTFELFLSSFNTSMGILRSAHTGNLNDLQQSIENETPWYVQDFTYTINNPKQNISHQLLKTKGMWQLNNLANLSIQYALQFNQREEYDIRRGGRNDIPALSLSLITNTIDIIYDQNNDNKSRSIGLSGTLKNNTNEPDLGIKPLLPQYDQIGTGLYLHEKRRSSRWLLEYGGRYDYQFLEVSTFDADKNLIKPRYHFHFGAASLGASYYISSSSRLINNASFSTRPPHVSELFSEGLHHSTGSIEEGILYEDGDWDTNEKLLMETSYKWSSTYQLEKNNLAMEVSAYANLLKNFVSLQPTDTRLTIRGYFPVFQFVQTDAVLSGADMSIRWIVHKNLTYTAKGSYLYVQDVTNEDRLVYMPPAQMEHAFSFHFDWKNMHETFLTLRVPTFFKQTRAPRTLFPKDVATDTSDKNFDFMPPPNGDTLVHLEAGTSIPFDKHTLVFSIAAENIFNEAYRNYMNRLRYFADDIGFNLSIRLAYKFHTHAKQ